MQVKYQFSDTEIKKILAENLVIVVDSREQMNIHIIDFFDKKKINYEVKKVDSGDYSVKITPIPELGIIRDCYLPVCIERKNSVDELASSIKDRTRFTDEFLRATKDNTKIYLLVEQHNGYEDILNNNYRSQYEPKALIASLKTFEVRFDFTATFLDKKLSGDWIYRTLFYYTREYLKS